MSAGDGGVGGGRGIVRLVGAGPGDPELLTVKALRYLRNADAVVYDALVPEAFLEFARTDAIKVNVGKRASRHTLPQDEINAVLVSLARQGLDVVRLKGGDPFVFGRGAEEALALANAGIAFEVVPGVTSGTAVPAAAGIPVTHRDVARTVTFFTAHTSRDGSDPVDYAALGRLNGTLVAFMGLGRLDEVARGLREAGRRADLPVAVISRGTTPSQTVVFGTLEDIAARARAAAVEAPALVVIGEVVELSAHLAVNALIGSTTDS
ncbi:MAG: uroporphyrinogen-III C-methyltransferase [Polyangiaceae bacterium]